MQHIQQKQNKETLYFHFEDINTKKVFKVNFEEIFQIINFLIKQKKLKNIPYKVSSEILKKFNISEKSDTYNTTIIDTFDWKGESKREKEELIQEKNYEKYIQKKNSR